MIEIKNITKVLGDTLVLENASLTIQDKSIFGLVGVNGAGKSTLIRCLMGIYKVDKGEILVDGEPVYENNDVKKDMLLVSDDPYFPRAATINSIADYYRRFYDFNEDRFLKYLEMFSLERNKPLTNFSKGMKRQVFLLMALAVGPEILILDEAFDGLDPLVRLNFKRALAELIEQNETTVLISSHNLKELEDICDSFAILDGHHFTVSGDLDEEKENTNKYQLAFKEEVSEDYFKEFDMIDLKISGKVVNVIIRGRKDEVSKKLEALNPLMLEVLPLNFEEIFISEIEKTGGIK